MGVKLTRQILHQGNHSSDTPVEDRVSQIHATDPTVA